MGYHADKPIESVVYCLISGQVAYTKHAGNKNNNYFTINIKFIIVIVESLSKQPQCTLKLQLFAHLRKLAIVQFPLRLRDHSFSKS